MKTTQKQINDFFGNKKIAVAGVSRDPKKFSTVAFNELKERGFDVYPVNPNVDSVNGVKCYSSVATLPADVGSLLIVTSKNQTLDVLKDAVSRSVPNIWIQQMSETPEVMAFIKTHKLTLITRQCVLMFAEPVKSFHKFHRTIKRLFGLLPK